MDNIPIGKLPRMQASLMGNVSIGKLPCMLASRMDNAPIDNLPCCAGPLTYQRPDISIIRYIRNEMQ